MDAQLDSFQKPFWRSKTLLGVLILLLPTVLGLFGAKLDDAQTQELAEAIVALVGAVLAVVGRLTAKTELVVPKQVPAILFAALLAGAFTGCKTPRILGKLCFTQNGTTACVGSDGKTITLEASGGLAK